ncbi:hypothetical protein RIF29_35387 [Crotalaria pallida]|uniref:Uncharacterized protein n=1 Tax=Crotalaria pallida TaxID=3830 RepID=A0AAN9EA87_CROPI
MSKTPILARGVSISFPFYSNKSGDIPVDYTAEAKGKDCRKLVHVHYKFYEIPMKIVKRYIHVQSAAFVKTTNKSFNFSPSSVKVR